MERNEQIAFLQQRLLREMPQYRRDARRFGKGPDSQRRLLRSLMNVRPPELPLDNDFLQVQNALLSAERTDRGIVDGAALTVTAAHPQIALWLGDITTLAVDAIVNAANSGLTGCYIPCHKCIDNAIHSAAGLELRAECGAIMQKQGYPEPTGQAKLTAGYNLPARYVLHTVGPIVDGVLTETHRTQLASCYRACLELASEHGLESVAFCCISTGEFRFPNREAAEIAVATVLDFLKVKTSISKVIFNVFKNSDYEIYRVLLGPDGTAPAGA